MKSAVYYSPGDIRLEEHSEPFPKKNNMVARVHCCAICGTDLKLYTIGNPRCHAPRIIGHEMVGTLMHVGSEVKGFKVGERITLATTVACGKCRVCARGLGNICPNAKPISYDFDAAFAEFIAVPPEALQGGNVINVPDSVTDDEAALSEPLSCAINAQEIINVSKGDSVLIIGGGPLGAIHAELAKANGAEPVMVIQRSEPRLSTLRKINDIIVIDGASQDIESVVMEKTSDFGVDAVIACAPSREAQEDSIKYARKGGVVSLFASLPKGASDINLDSRIIHYGELRLAGASDSRPEHVRKAVDMMEKRKINLEPIITHRINLEEIHEGLELMKRKECLKVLVYPQGLNNETGR